MILMMHVFKYLACKLLHLDDPLPSCVQTAGWRRK